MMILINILPRVDGNMDDKLGTLNSSQCGLVELAAVLFYRVVTRNSAFDSWT
jgi:hypothetical protein